MEEEKKKISPILIIVGVAVVAILALVFVKGRKSGQTPITENPTSKPEISEPTNTFLDETALSEGEAKIVSVEGGSYYYKPNEIKVKVGDKVKIIFLTKGGSHNFVIDEFGVQTDEINAGKTVEVEFTADKTGTFEFYCSIANHRAMGMKGKIIVE